MGAAALAASALIGAGAGIGAYAALDGGAPAAAPAAAEVAAGTPVADRATGAAAVHRRAAAGVVEVSTAGAAALGPFGGARPVEGVGSGFLYDEEGRVVTNQHVVDGADTVTVTFADGTARRARVLGSDASTDLAVLEVDDPPASATPLPLADPGSVEVGEEVVAIGSPYGLEGTVTAGVVSALDRDITAPDGRAISGVIQTDAAINQGNSGGPLLDAGGRVIGVNAQIESEGGGNDGIGFAIPSDTVRSVADQLVAGEPVRHPYLGVEIATVGPDAAAALGAPERGAVALVEVVDGSPAGRAGLRAATGTREVDGVPVPSGGDLVSAVDGEPVAAAEDLQAAIAARRPGERVDLTVHRDGERRTVTVTVGTQPS